MALPNGFQDNFYNYCLSESARRDREFDANRVRTIIFATPTYSHRRTTYRACTQDLNLMVNKRQPHYLASNSESRNMDPPFQKKRSQLYKDYKLTQILIAGFLVSGCPFQTSTEARKKNSCSHKNLDLLRLLVYRCVLKAMYPQ